MTPQGEQRLADYLEHMKEAIHLARSHVAGMNEEAFLQDKRTQQAVILNVLIIGEAATKLVQRYGDFAASHPDVP